MFQENGFSNECGDELRNENRINIIKKLMELTAHAVAVDNDVQNQNPKSPLMVCDLNGSRFEIDKDGMFHLYQYIKIDLCPSMEKTTKNVEELSKSRKYRNRLGQIQFRMRRGKPPKQ